MVISSVLVSIGISVAFLTGIGILLSLLLILAERKLLNYGTCRISINNGEKDLEVQGGASLLAGLAENEIFIPSACGGRGTCAYCKVAVSEGGGIITPVEEPNLTPEDREKNIRLSCQVKIRNDLKILIPEELFLVKRYTGIIAHKRPLTHDIVELRIRLQEPASIDFTAGQYIQLESEQYGNCDAVTRAYSIASVPSDKHHIELIIRRVPDGICTTWVFDHLKEGQPVVFYGPYGEFRLTDTQAPIIFIAGGSGMAPIWSMIRHMVEQGIQRPAHYFFGALTQQDLFFVEDLKKIEQEQSWFKFIPALSNEPEDSDYEGEKGLITDVVAGYFPDCSRHEAYLCGSPGMLDACIDVLNQSGMPTENIYFDKFA